MSLASINKTFYAFNAIFCYHSILIIQTDKFHASSVNFKGSWTSHFVEESQI